LILCTGKRRLALTHDDLNMAPDDDEETGFETSAELRHGDTFDHPSAPPDPSGHWAKRRVSIVLVAVLVAVFLLVVLLILYLFVWR
jgi:hypothetical protein